MRLLIHLVPGNDWEAVAAGLRRLGLDDPRPPIPELPGVATVDVPGGADVEASRAAAERLPGVRLVEIDRPHTAF